MAEPYVGEVRMFGGNFAPAGWMFCEGQLLSISENGTLFQIIGTTYGGDGQNTFALPDLRGRLPVHQGNGFTLAQSGGVEQMMLTVNQIPAHSHPLLASTRPGNTNAPAGNVAGESAVKIYVAEAPTASLSSLAVSNAGSNQPHDNLQPYLCISFIISLFGIYPSQA